MAANKPWISKNAPVAAVDPNAPTVGFFSALPLLQMYATALKPGALYWGNVYYTASDDSYGSGQGQQQPVRDDGSIFFLFPIGFLTHGEVGTVTAWVSQDYLGPALLDSAGNPAVVTIKYP